MLRESLSELEIERFRDPLKIEGQAVAFQKEKMNNLYVLSRERVAFDLFKNCLIFP